MDLTTGGTATKVMIILIHYNTQQMVEQLG